MSRKKLRAWIEAMRLRTLPVSVAGVFAGCACALALHRFEWLPALICFFFAVGAQIVSNFANEYYDYKNGLDRKGREGFRRGVTEGDLTPRAMKRATYGLLAATCLLGCTLIYWGGWWLIAVGVAVAVFAMAYSTGPWPLSHHGLGDVAVVVFFGFVPVMLTAWLQTGGTEVWAESAPLGAAVGLMAMNVLIVNNYRDADDDRIVGKHTTVVRFGRRAMAGVYLVSGLLASVIIFIWAGMWCDTAFAYGSAAGYAVVHVMNWRRLKSESGKALNKVLASTAKLMLAECAWLFGVCAVVAVS